VAPPVSALCLRLTGAGGPDIALNSAVYFRNFLAYCLQLLDTAHALEGDDSVRFQSMVASVDAVIQTHRQQLVDVHTRHAGFFVLPDIDKVRSWR
jgi:hypothetical protein